MSVTDRLDEIQRRAEDSWSGPWTWELDDAERVTLHAGGSVPFDLVLNDEFRGPSEVVDFIAHARNDVPVLVAALRAMLHRHRPVRSSLVEGLICDRCIDGWGEPELHPCEEYDALIAALGEGA